MSKKAASSTSKPEAEEEEEVQYHIHLRTGDAGRYVLLPGDPGRCKQIAAHFDDAKMITSNREYTTYTGYLLGEKVSCCSTGIGCPSTAIAVEELIKTGSDTFIRVGLSGGMQPGTRTGDIAVVTGAIRDEGTSKQYLPLEFPAVADADVVLTLREAATHLDIPYRCGVTHSKDSFYGETEKDRMPMHFELKRKWESWINGGAICSEMESATIFVLASIHRKRAGSVNTMCAKDEHLPKNLEGKKLFTEDRAGLVAIEALKRLITRDREAAEKLKMPPPIQSNVLSNSNPDQQPTKHQRTA